ncbi:MAG: hypothetical protein RI894_1392 [Bacteroidota bacterium]
MMIAAGAAAITVGLAAFGGKGVEKGNAGKLQIEIGGAYEQQKNAA